MIGPEKSWSAPGCLSALSALRAPGTRQWWGTARGGFSDLLSVWVDQQLAAELPHAMHAGLGLEVSGE